MKIQSRLLVDCHVFDGSFQGTTTYIKGIYSEFIKDKEYQFFFVSNDSNQLAEIFGHHENVVYVQYKSSNKYFRLLFEIPAIIKRYNIDFAHFQYIVPPIKRCKYIVTIHDILFLKYPKFFPIVYRLRNKILFKWSGKFSEIVLTVSDYSKNQIKELFNIKDITVTTNAVDPVFFEPYNKASVRQEICNTYGFDRYWVYVSRWEPRKNHDSLLKVFVENEYYKDYTLVFIGNKAIENKKYNNYYKTLSREIQSRVIRLEGVDFISLVKLLRGASLSVYPSFAEGFGIPPLEAIASGIQSVCSNSTAMSDFGFMKNMMFHPSDVSEMKKCIDKGLSTNFDAKLKEELLQKYNWVNSVKKLKLKIKAHT